MFSFHSLSIITYSEWIVVVVTAIFCGAIWYTFFYKRNWFNYILPAILIIGLIVVWFQWNTLQKQVMHIINGFTTGASGTMSVTLTAVLFGIILSLIIFFLEFIMQSHAILFLVTMVLMIFGPLIGLQINIITLMLLMLFQVAFAVMNMTSLRLGKNSFSAKNRGSISVKSGIAACIAMVLALIIAFPLAQLNANELYNSVYSAEEYAYYTLNQIPGISTNSGSISNGQINRGNIYQTGEQKLEVTVDIKPTEKLYLKGFSGEDYFNENWWCTLNDYDIVSEICDSRGLDLDYYGYYMKYCMYFYINSISNPMPIGFSDYSYEDYDIPVMRGLNIWNLDENAQSSYSYVSYVPYYSEICDSSNYFYYEQKDMNIDWNTSNSDISRLHYFCNLYMQEIQTAYTQVPKENLPRLTALCEKTPLTDLNEITTYILYTLNSNTSYTLTPGMAPANKDIAEYFLFDNGKGYCVHYATVATLMYHMYGIPARYVSGYMVEPSQFEYQSEYSYKAFITDKSAHAWVEIYLEDYGWTPVEVTPATDGTIVTTYPGFDKEEMERIMDKYGWDMNVPSLSITSDTDVQEKSELENNASESTSGEYPIWFIILSTIIVYSIVLTPLFLDYRRLRKLRKLEAMNCLKIFGLLIQMLHFVGILKEYDGSEENFAERLSKEISVISANDAARMMDIIICAAYGKEMPKKSDQAFVKKIYKRTSVYIYNHLKLHKKLLFRYWKAFI